MRTVLAAFTLALLSTSALAATPDEILAANRAASGGNAWNGKVAMAQDYDYAGNGLTGKLGSTLDLTNGAFEQHYAIGPQTGANGYDGTHVWQKDNAGIVTLQEGGDAVPLAVNTAYRNANLWWRGDHGGATITGGAQKTENGAAYDVLTVVPKGGATFDAWFDAKTHLLYRVIETQGGVLTTTTTTDYADFNGTHQATHTLVNQGDAKYDQRLTLTKVNFLPVSAAASYAAPASAAADFTFPPGAHQVTLKFDLISNHIHAHAMINGKGPFPVIFDTGGVNLINPELAKELGIKLEGAAAARGAGDSTMEYSLTRIDSVNVGGATINNQVFIALALDALFPSNGVVMRGMIGYETFRHFVTEIDYGKRTVTLTDPKYFDPRNSGTPIKFQFNGNAVIVDGSYDGVPGKFQIDTGARNSLTLNGPFVATNHLREKDGKGVDAVDGWGVGGPSRSHVVRGGALVVGGMTLAMHPVVGMSTDTGGSFADAALNGNIGGGTLKRFVVTFDYGNKVMYLKPVTEPLEDVDTYDRAGMWFNTYPEGYRIINVTPGGPADAAGLKEGDVIERIDGAKTIPGDLGTVRWHLRNDPAGKVVTFKITRAGQTSDVKVTLRDQI